MNTYNSRTTSLQKYVDVNVDVFGIYYTLRQRLKFVESGREGEKKLIIIILALIF